MEIVVRKFGGSSLSTEGQVRRVAELTAATHQSGRPTVVVVSARGSTTDDLIRLARGFTCGTIPTDSMRELDQLLVTGEVASAAQLAVAVRGLGTPAVSLTGGQAGIEVSGEHGSGRITTVHAERVTELLREGNVVIVGGFHGINADGDTVTLGRGGSDTTAVALAAALRTQGCEIYTDVDGVCTADPRVVGSARTLPVVDGGVMAELAYAGAKVVHSRAAELAATRRVELRVGKSSGACSGTLVTRAQRDVMEADGVVLAIAHDSKVAWVVVRLRRGLADPTAQVLAALARWSIPSDQLARFSSHEHGLTLGFTIQASDAETVKLALRGPDCDLDADVLVDDRVAKVSLVGMGLLNRPECSIRMMSALAAGGIPTCWVSTSQLRVSVVVPRHRTVEAVELLHREFELDRCALELEPVSA